MDVTDWGKYASNPQDAQDFLKNKIKDFTGQFTGHATGEQMERNKTIEGYKRFDDNTTSLQLVRKPEES